MSQTMTQNRPPVTEDDVIAWLRANPQFLSRNPDAAELLVPPKRVNQDRKVADFQSYMIGRLKDDRDDVLRSAREIVENTRANMNNQARIHNAVLMLLEAVNFEDFVHTMTMDLAALLNIDIISLVIEIDDEIVPQIDLSGVRIVNAGTIDLLTRKHPIILESNIAGMDELYGGGAGLVKSQALLRLNVSNNVPSVMLAFGSRDPNLFAAGLATDHIVFLGHVIERCFRIWLRIGA